MQDQQVAAASAAGSDAQERAEQAANRTAYPRGTPQWETFRTGCVDGLEGNRPVDTDGLARWLAEPYTAGYEAGFAMRNEDRAARVAGREA